MFSYWHFRLSLFYYHSYSISYKWFLSKKSIREEIKFVEGWITKKKRKKKDLLKGHILPKKPRYFWFSIIDDVLTELLFLFSNYHKESEDLLLDSSVYKRVFWLIFLMILFWSVLMAFDDDPLQENKSKVLKRLT